MRFSYVILAVSFMLFCNILYAGMKGDSFDFTMCPSPLNGTEYCSATFGVPAFLEAPISGVYSSADYRFCLDKIGLDPVEKYCGDVPYYNYYTTPFTEYETAGMDDTQELKTSWESVSRAISLMITVPFDNPYLLFINAVAWLIVIIFGYKAILPSGGTD